jgi:integrase
MNSVVPPPTGELASTRPSSLLPPQLCFEVTAVNGEPRVRVAEPKPKREYRDSKVFKFPACPVAIPYQEYRNASGRYWTLFYYEGGRRRRESRTSFEKLRARAEQIATNIANGQTAMNDFGEAKRASYLRAVEIAAPTGKPLELVASIYTECVQILGDRATPEEACRYFVAQHLVGVIARNVPQIVEELLAKKTISSKWRRNLAKMLERFAARFTGPLGLLQTRDLEDWLDGLAGGLRTRRNHRNAIENLINFARARGYLLKDWESLSTVSNPKPPAAQVNLYTPDELVRLLHLAETTKGGRKLVPLICITAFAGVRHGEMNEEKLELLDWADLDFEGKGIYICPGAAKTGRDRAVDMPDNLIAWLEPYRRPRGKICSIANSWDALCKLRKKAGIPPKKNGLRKSFISYRLALTRNIDGVADQAGNSSAIIRKNYKRTDTRMKKDAERWFAILPTRADVLPLFAWAKQL